MAKSSKHEASWSNVHGSIIKNISKHLKTRDQILRFKQVCKKWNNRSVPLPVNHLSVTLPLTIPISITSKPPFHSSMLPLVLRVSSIYLITPSSDDSLKPWMIMAEESNPGKVQLRHPLTAKRVENFPSTLDLTRFRASELAQGYNFKHCNCTLKVLLLPLSSPDSLEVLVLYYKGKLVKLTVRVPQCREQAEAEKGEDCREGAYCWKNLQVKQRHNFCFQYLDDVVEFKEKHCAVDRKGRLYQLDINAMKVSRLMVTEPICIGSKNPSARRKRLVVDPTSGELHLLKRECRRASVSFIVYKFNELCKKWDVVENLGNEKVLFVGVDHCFFAKATDFPGCKGNCIVFSANCFTQYRGRNAPDGSLFRDEEVDVGVYRLGKGDNFRILSSAYPEFSKSIWPPPSWFSAKSECSNEETGSGSSSQQASDEGSSSSIKSLSDDHVEGTLSDSSGESSSDKEEDEDEELLLDSSSSKPSQASDSDKITSSDEDEEDEGQMSSANGQSCEFEANSSVPPFATEHRKQIVETSTMNYQITGEASGSDCPKEEVFPANSSPMTPPTQLNLPACTTVKFEGLDIKSELLPTLKTIWVKHGSLIGENTVRSKNMLTCALESAAELVITLQNTTGRTLTSSQADEFKSTLSDLQRLGLKVDWLVPPVEKASKLLSNKPLLESFMLLDKKKAQVDKEEKEYLAISAKIKQEIEEDMASLSAKIPSPEIIDLDNCLGGGLF